MSNKNKNIAAAMEEPARLARHEGVIYYQCELGPIFAVNEADLFEIWRRDLSLERTDTTVVAELPAAAEVFEIGDGPANAGGDADVPASLLTSSLGAMDEAIEQWATYCDGRAGEPSIGAMLDGIRGAGVVGQQAVL